MSAGCSASGLRAWNRNSTLRRRRASSDGSQVSIVSADDVSTRDPRLGRELPLRTSSFFHCRASLRTGCEPHWPGDALRHLGSDTQAGPGTATYCVRWPRPSKVWFHRMALGRPLGCWKKGQGPVTIAIARQHLPISLLIGCHMIAAGRSPCRDPPCRVELCSAPSLAVPGRVLLRCQSASAPPLSPPRRHTA